MAPRTPKCTPIEHGPTHRCRRRFKVRAACCERLVQRERRCVGHVEVKIIGQPHAALHVYLLCQLGPMRWSKTMASPNNTTIASALGSPITGSIATSLASMPKSDHLFLHPCSVRSVASGASGATNDKGQRPTSLVRLSQHGTTTNPM
jgi:hypothetical protein